MEEEDERSAIEKLIADEDDSVDAFGGGVDLAIEWVTRAVDNAAEP